MNKNRIFNHGSINAYVRNQLADTGLPFGVDIKQRLELLCESIDRNNRLNRDGQKILLRQIADNIINNLLVTEAALKSPDVHEINVAKPIFIIGLPRTGTSLLHKLMALDKDNRVLTLKEALKPVLPNKAGENYREKYAESWISVMNKTIKKTRKMIDISTHSPVECCFLKRNSLRCHSISYQAKLDMLEGNWLNHENLSKCYGLYKLQLQLIQQQSNTGRWLLKCPSHFPSIKHLHSNFPGATFVCTHRDMSDVIASFTSLISTIRFCLTKELSRELVATELVKNIQTQIRMHYESRRLNPALRVTDVSYKNLEKDPIGCVYEIYQKNKIPYSLQFERNMSRWLRLNPHEKHGKHIYNLSMFGLSRDSIYKLCGETLEKIDYQTVQNY